ncbi:hypothetical protein D3C85_162540 [compost metagenome]
MVQEHDAFIVLGGIEVHVGHQRFAFRQNREFEVVGGEQRVGAQLGQSLGCRPGQRQAVEGAGAAADFVHQHQAAFTGVVQDVGSLAHLHHEGRTTTGQVVARADTGEDAVDQRQLAAFRRDEAADMGQQHDQRGLPHIGGFTAHVRPGDDQHARVVVEAQVVGHEGRGQHLFDHRMTALLDAHAGFVDEAWPVEVEVQCALAQVAQHVQFGQGRGAVLQRAEVTDQTFQQLFVEHLLAGQGAALGRQGLVLELLEFGGDEAFRALEGLAADIVGRGRLGLLARQFDKVAVHAVVADLEVGQAGAGFLAHFQVHQVLAGVFAERLQLVQLGVVAGLEYAAVADHRRWVVDNGAGQQLGQLRVGADGAGQVRQVRRLEVGHGHLQRRQGRQGIAQTRQIARPGVAQADAGEDALQIADFLELRLQGLEAVAFEQAGNRFLARFQYGAVAQRAVQPAAEQAAAHGGLATVDYRLQGVVAAAGEVDVQLQVTAAGAVENHGVVEALMTQAAQVRQGGTLGFLGVAEQAAGGADGQGQVLAAETFQILGGELLTEALVRAVALEVPGCTAACAAAFFCRQALGPVVRDQQFDRVEALQFGQQVFPAIDLQYAETATGDVQHRQAEQPFVAQYRGQQVVAALVEQGFVADRAGGDDAHHLAFHRPLAGRRVADLLADDHRLAELDQLGQVAFGGVVGNPAHGDRLTGRLAAGGEGDIQQLGGLFRVLVENLVEVAHAVEHQLVRVLVLQSPVLLHHRGVAG